MKAQETIKDYFLDWEYKRPDLINYYWFIHRHYNPQVLSFTLFIAFFFIFIFFFLFAFFSSSFSDLTSGKSSFS
jgi:hypothetical protein